MNHTKGEWKVMHKNCNELQTTFHGVAIGDTFVEIPTQNELADARIIAAAPEMLNQIKRILTAVEEMLDDSGVVGASYYFDEDDVVSLKSTIKKTGDVL